VKRKISFNQAKKRLDRFGQELSGVKISRDPERASIELEMQAVIARIKKEGINA